LDVTSNVSAGNVKTDNLLYANGTAWSFGGGGGTSYSNTNVAAYLPTYTGNVSANYFIGNGATLTNITGANVSGNVTSAVQSHYANIANSVTGANVSGQVSNALIAGTVYTDAQPNITSVGTLSSLTVSGLITATGTGIKAANIQDTSGTVTLVTGYGSKVGDVGVYGNITAGTSGTGNVIGTYLTGTLTTAAQPNITSVGTLSSLTVTGNISAGNLTLTGSISDSAQLDILTTASSANIVLTPNGSGNVNTPANLTVTGNVTASGITANNTLTIQQVAEKVKVNASTGSGNFALDYSTGSTLLLGGLSGNINLVISNLPSSSNISIVTTVVITQGGTPYIPSNVYVGASLATILWSGGTVPTGTASKTEAFSFALLNNSGTWTVLGQNSSYG
jgi:hypothetical protein